ncbi:MAG: hypothetical protein LBE86_16020 [Gemmobacter sp.]|jgi:hypothetical protein|nr:hypothetical protein [Gemmobacter sp.]
MKKLVLAGALGAFILPLMSAAVAAGPIERACNRTAKGNRGVCSCIQQVADMTLSGPDQRRAAKLMKNPDLAHEVWVSKREADDRFWERYKSFGQTAEAYCAG